MVQVGPSWSTNSCLTIENYALKIQCLYLLVVRRRFGLFSFPRSRKGLRAGVRELPACNLSGGVDILIEDLLMAPSELQVS